VRRCAACREAAPKRELIRLVRTEGGWRLDLAQRAGGRGTSLCRTCARVAVAAAARARVAATAPADAAPRPSADDQARLKGFRRAFRHEADAVAALLEPIRPLLDDAATPPGAAVTAAGGQRPRPNGGMHG
jgi:hypothetical protein